MTLRTVSCGNVSLIVRKMADGRWRCWYKEDGKRRAFTGDYETVIQKASDKAQQLADGRDAPQCTVPINELDEFHAWKASKDSGHSLSRVLTYFLEHQQRKSRRTDRTFTELRNALTAAVDFLGAERKIKTLLAPDLERWIHQNPNHAARTRHHRRARLVQFFRWARDNEFLPMARTAADKTAEIDYLPGKREILTPDQVDTLLANVKPKYLPYVLLSLYAGIRHQEILPDRKIKTLLAPDLERWIHQNPNHAARTRHHRRARLVQFFRWARDNEFLPMARTAADKTAEIDYLPGKREILTPDQVDTLLANVKPKYLPYVLLSLYAGIRHQEILPDRKSNKDRLQWQDIDQKEALIRIRPEVAKGRRGRPRIVSIQPVLGSWLRHLTDTTPRIGPILTGEPFTAEESRRLAPLLGLDKWPHNCLRHSYASYRMAICRDAPRVSEEMGNSPADIRQHYDAVVSEAVAREFWERLTPKSAKLKSY